MMVQFGYEFGRELPLSFDTNGVVFAVLRWFGLAVVLMTVIEGCLHNHHRLLRKLAFQHVERFG